MPSSFVLPRSVRGVSRCALDVGGSLAKLVYFHTPPQTASRHSSSSSIPNDPVNTNKNERFILAQREYGGTGERNEELELTLPGGRVHFIKFRSERMASAVRLVVKEGLSVPGGVLVVTGGGAHRHTRALKEAFPGVRITNADEMRSVVAGILFAFRFISNGPCFTLRNISFGGDRGDERTNIHVEVVDGAAIASEGFLVVNIGTGVSMIDVDGAGNYKRVGGSSLGGGTFLGLCRLLAGAEDFATALRLATRGDSRNVDLLCQDIYGDDSGLLAKHGLRPRTLASSFGKVGRSGQDQLERFFLKKALAFGSSRAAASGEEEGGEEEEKDETEDEAEDEEGAEPKQFTPQDACLATLIMISMNVAAIAHLQAKIHNRATIVFTGGFLTTTGRKQPVGATGVKPRQQHEPSPSPNALVKRNTIAMRTLSYAVHFWTEGGVLPVFLRHEGYMCALGALVQMHDDDDARQPSSRL